VNKRQISAVTFVVLTGASGLGYGAALGADNTASASDRATAQSAADASSARALNLGQRATTAEGELHGVAGYPQYAAEVVGVGANDWAQWGGSSIRNNTPEAKHVPSEWNPGEFDEKTGQWNAKSSKNIKWVARLGSTSHGSPIVANGKVFVGTNNGSAYLKRYPAETDLGALLCFDEKTGEFLWQDSSEKLSTGRENDWPLQGICSTPLVEGNRLWYVSSRGEIKCLGLEGFRAIKHDGSTKPSLLRLLHQRNVVLEKDPVAIWETEKEAEVIWVLDMMRQLGTKQHNQCRSSMTAAGDVLFVNTSNGVDMAHVKLPAPDAPTLIAVDKNNGAVLWTDNTPGANVLHGQWSSPSYAVIGGQPQVIFGAGDGWLYSFDAHGDGNGKSKLLWKFDGNPKTASYLIADRSKRNHFLGTPVVYKGRVYIGLGEDPEHGEGAGHLWCVDATGRGDVSPELVFNQAHPDQPISPKRIQACVAADGDFTRPNPNSAAVWHYEGEDLNGNGKLEFEETMHRTIGSVVIKDDLLVIVDFSGLVHCLDAASGKCHWTYDMLSACWTSPLIVDGKIYVGNEDGQVLIFKLAPKMEIVSKAADGTPGGIEMESSIYTSPIVANGVLFISTKEHLFAIQSPGNE
jgi:outer membrane protein assembly factor BamB